MRLYPEGVPRIETTQVMERGAFWQKIQWVKQRKESVMDVVNCGAYSAAGASASEYKSQWSEPEQAGRV